jgi:hypothetical protein
MQITKKIITEFQYCCTNMKTAVEGKAIMLPKDGNPDVPTRIFGPHDTILGGLRKSFDIQHCPFCGTKIEFKEN